MKLRPSVGEANTKNFLTIENLELYFTCYKTYHQQKCTCTAGCLTYSQTHFVQRTVIKAVFFFHCAFSWSSQVIQQILYSSTGQLLLWWWRGVQQLSTTCNLRSGLDEGAIICTTILQYIARRKCLQLNIKCLQTTLKPLMTVLMQIAFQVSHSSHSLYVNTKYCTLN